MKKRGKEMKEVWDKIPEWTDILVTHGPPNGMLDLVKEGARKTKNAGCEELTKAVERVKPRLHVFGHIHSGYGQERFGGTHFVNCAHLNEDYEAVNKPIRVIL